MAEHFRIQWFPGHMAKAQREMQAQLKTVDFVIEVADARAPYATRNPELDGMAPGKPRLLVLSKGDLADPHLLKRWIDQLRSEGIDTVGASLLSPSDVTKLRHRMTRMVGSRRFSPGGSGERRAFRGAGVSMPRGQRRIVRGMVVGMPNTGKSTLIRMLGGRGVQVGAKAGVTRRIRWIPVTGDIELLDTPGLMWPRAETGDIALHLAWVGSVSEVVYDAVAAAEQWIVRVKKDGATVFWERYGIERKIGLKNEPWQILEHIATQRGFLNADGSVDVEQAARTVVHELRRGLFGPIMLDLPHPDPSH